MSYIDGSDLASFLGATSLSDDDADRAAAAAQSWVDGYCRRTFTLAGSPSSRLFEVRNPYLLEVTDIADSDITIGDGSGYASEWDADDFMLTPATPSEGWPYTGIRAISTRAFRSDAPGLVQITATWGWPTVPDDVKHAALIQAARLYKRRESPEGVLGGNDFGIVRVGAHVDPDVAALLQRYRLPVGIA